VPLLLPLPLILPLPLLRLLPLLLLMLRLLLLPLPLLLLLLLLVPGRHHRSPLPPLPPHPCLAGAQLHGDGLEEGGHIRLTHAPPAASHLRQDMMWPGCASKVV
jgi:hypothetical protein